MEIISEPTSSNIELSNVCEVTNEITHESDLNSNKNKEDITISLTNFDPYCKKKYFLNSPRSIEACKLKGIEQWELLAKTIKEVEDEPIPSKFKEFKQEFLELKTSFYEKNRQYRLQLCLEARDKIIEKETYLSQSTHREYFSVTKRPHQRSVTPPQKIIEEGNRNLEVMKRKQVKEIGGILESDQLKDQLELRLAEKKQKLRMIKEEQKKKVRQKKKEEEHAKTMREYRKKEIDEEREKQLRRKNHETCMQTYEEKEADRQAESAVIQFLWKISGQNGNNNNDSEIHFIDSKEILQKRMTALQEVEERKKENTQQSIMEKMRKSEERLKKKEVDRMLMLDFRRLSTGMKQEEIQKTKEIKERAIVEREIQYLNKLIDIQNTKEKIKKEKEHERRIKSQKEAEHAEEVRYKAKMEEIERELRSQYLSREISEDLSRAESQRNEILSARKKSFMISFLKEEEARLNLARVNKAGEYQIEQIEGKITNRSNRIKSLSREREQIRYESIEAQKDVKRTKESAKEDFIRLKRRLERKLHEKNFPSMSHRNSTYSSPLKDRSSTKNTARSIASPDPRESFIFEYSPHKKRASTPLTEPTTSSTPIKSSRTTSLSHNRVMSGVCGSSILYEIILEEESKAAMQSNNTSKRQRRSRAQRGSMPNPYINIIDLSNVFKGEIELNLKTREASSHLGTARSELDYEDPPFEGKMSEIKRIRKVDNQEIIKILEREVHLCTGTEESFQKSANRILKSVKSQKERIENLMQKANYLELPRGKPKQKGI